MIDAQFEPIYPCIAQAIRMAEADEENDLDALDWEGISYEIPLLYVCRNGQWEVEVDVKPDLEQNDIVPNDDTGITDRVSGLQILITHPSTYDARIRLIEAAAQHINILMDCYQKEDHPMWQQLLTVVLVLAMGWSVRHQADDQMENMVPQITEQLQDNLLNDLTTSIKETMDKMRAERPQSDLSMMRIDVERTWERVTDTAVQRKMVGRVEEEIRRVCREGTATALSQVLYSYSIPGFLDIKNLKKTELYRELNEIFGPLHYSYSNFKQAYPYRPKPQPKS